MAVNKNKKVTEEVVAQTEAPSTEITNNANDMTAQFMEMLASMKEIISSLKSKLDEQKKKNEELEKKYEAQEVTPVMEVTPVVSSTLPDTTERLLEILGNKKSDKEVVIVHNRELLGGLATSIRLTGAAIDFHTLGEERVLSWQQFEECVSKYRKWFDKEIILIGAGYEDVAERYNIPCVKRGNYNYVTKKDLAEIYKKSERQLEDYLNTLTEEDKDFVCSYWLGKCYEKDSRYIDRAKIELLNRISNKHIFDNYIATLNFGYFAK